MKLSIFSFLDILSSALGNSPHPVDSGRSTPERDSINISKSQPTGNSLYPSAYCSVSTLPSRHIYAWF